MIDYSYVQAVLWLQLWAWYSLYNYPVELGRLSESLFYAAGICAIILVQVFQPHIGYFTPWLISQYMFYTLASVSVFKTRFMFRKALCLGFLVVFLNSFYWELFYHIYEFQLWWPNSLSLEWWYLRIPQWIRVIPAYFLSRWFNIRDMRWVGLGLAVSFALTYARFVFHWGDWVHPIHRVICLGALLFTTYISPEKQTLGDSNG